ncbi:hypothetical protein IWX58_000160 [Rubrivivax gelatinosus]|nr:hypothetical protein [Rubrivivax gelatinosus]
MTGVWQDAVAEALRGAAVAFETVTARHDPAQVE